MEAKTAILASIHRNLRNEKRSSPDGSDGKAIATRCRPLGIVAAEVEVVGSGSHRPVDVPRPIEASRCAFLHLRAIHISCGRQEDAVAAWTYDAVACNAVECLGCPGALRGQVGNLAAGGQPPPTAPSLTGHIVLRTADIGADELVHILIIIGICSLGIGVLRRRLTPCKEVAVLLRGRSSDIEGGPAHGEAQVHGLIQLGLGDGGEIHPLDGGDGEREGRRGVMLMDEHGEAVILMACHNGERDTVDVGNRQLRRFTRRVMDNQDVERLLSGDGSGEEYEQQCPQVAFHC